MEEDDDGTADVVVALQLPMLLLGPGITGLCGDSEDGDNVPCAEIGSTVNRFDLTGSDGDGV